LIGFSLILLALAVCSGWLAYSIHPLFVILRWVFILLWLFVVSFFRDPQRIIPTDTDALVSPADGTVTHVETIDEPDFTGNPALRISIFLSVFNVHVNRVPRSGTVTAVRYFRGEYLDARHAECQLRNEQLWLDMEDKLTRRPIRVKQISGAIARRIVCKLKAGDEVAAGERFGMIKFGSRTDVIIPAAMAKEVLVKVGDKVRGGSTTLMRVN
jgi:phosphatidylserine decarboxylase